MVVVKINAIEVAPGRGAALEERFANRREQEVQRDERDDDQHRRQDHLAPAVSAKTNPAAP